MTHKFRTEYDLTSVPANWVQHPDAPADDRPRWANRLPPPPRGTTVRARFNGLGEGHVTGYFIEEGYLGLYVNLLNPPAWWVTQGMKNNRRDWRAMVFGAEITYLLAD